MSSSSSPTSHIGRVGALAVALGIGAAIATGTGAARANTTDATGTKTESSEQAPGRTSAGAASSSTSPGQVRRSPRSSRTSSRPANERDGAGIPRAGAAERAGIAIVAPIRNEAPTSSPSEPKAPTTISTSTVAPRPAAASVALRVQPVAEVPTPAATAGADQVAAPAVTVATVAPALTTTPAAAAATVAPAPQTAVAPLRPVARLLSALGLAPVAGGGTPTAPAGSPALWALLGWTRRDPGRAGVRTAARTAPASATTALVTTPTTLDSTHVRWVTGQNYTIPNPGWNWPAPTPNTAGFNIYGTDLGIMWFNGDNGLTQLAFGDTFSGPNMSGGWRSNVLLLSDDTTLSDGLNLVQTGPAYQFIPAAKNQVFFIGSEVTVIPTSAVYANGENYVNYMSVKSWDTPGRWTTNYSAVSMYDEATDKWVLQKSTVRAAGYFRSSTPYRAGDQNFQQMAYVLQPESKVEPGETRYVYAFGTPAGRAGSAYLSRVPENAVTDLGQYEYWDGNAWVTDTARAAPIIGDSTKSTGLLGPLRDLANDPNFLGGRMAGFVGAKTGGNVSEMSVQYNEYLDKYVVLYGNGSNNVILRTADDPTGPWSDPVTIATSIQYPGLYAPMIHPLSGTGQLTDPDNYLFWNMSLWGNYNVVLMKTDLSPLKTTVV